MAKFQIIILVSVFIVACSAEPPRFRTQFRGRNRFLARQELAEEIPAQTPYPPAGDTPEVEFPLPEEDNDISDDQAEINTPDQIYGPPGTEVESLEPQANLAVLPKTQRFTSSRKSSKLIQRGGRTRAAALKQAEPLQSPVQLQPLTLQQPLQLQQPQLLAQPILLADGRIVYPLIA